MNRYARNIVFLSIIFLMSCAYFVTWEESVSGGIGRAIEDISKVWGDPTEIKQREDRLIEYKYHLEKMDPSCIHYWIVNENGIIVDYRYEGRCRPA